MRGKGLGRLTPYLSLPQLAERNTESTNVEGFQHRTSAPLYASREKARESD
jgi:hypothetical protein